MNLSDVETLAHDLMSQHNLIRYGWSFRWNNGRDMAGLCNYRTKTLSLSRVLMPTWTEDAVREVILHEVAHALAGYSAGHGTAWKRIARSIGSTADRCWSPSEDAPMAPHTWIGRCAAGHEFGRYRRPNRGSTHSCPKPECGGRKFSPDHILRWERATA